MPESPLLELISRALPRDVHIDELAAPASRQAWPQDEEAAAIEALKNCPRLNWQAYLATYHDVAQAEIEPWLHYARHGIWEGRKLVSWNPLKKPEGPGQRPRISIIIANYNNAAYLPKCLESAIGQTMADLEIIVVDDCSTDNSMPIIESYASQDQRIKAIGKKENGGTFMARKSGVRASSGRYIMFVDADDFLAPNACALLYDVIILGYDIVEFGANVLNQNKVEQKNIINCSKYLNNGANGEYGRREMLDALFISQTLPWSIWNKIYLAEICKQAHEDIGDGHYVIGEDVYEMLAMANRARNLFKIPDKLYFYNYSSGISSNQTDRASYAKWFTIGGVVGEIGKFAQKFDFDIKFEKILEQHCVAAMLKWLSIVQDDDLNHYLDTIIRQYGKMVFLRCLGGRFADRPGQFAAKLSICLDNMPVQTREIRNIAIIHKGSPGGRDLGMINLYAGGLLKQGYQVSLIANLANDQKDALPDNLALDSIPAKFDSAKDSKAYLERLEDLAQANNYDLVIYTGKADSTLIQDFYFWHFYNIPVIACYENAFGRYLGNGAFNRDMDAIMAAAAAVICHSRVAMYFLRVLGINAWHAQPCCKSGMARPQGGEEPPDGLAAYWGNGARQMEQCLLVLKEAIKARPWSKIYIIHAFDDMGQRRAFFDKAAKYDLRANIHLAENPGAVNAAFGQCGVFLSTAIDEEDIDVVFKALSFGLPGVVYDVPVSLPNNGKGEAVVERGDYARAARELINILEAGKAKAALAQDAKMAALAARQEFVGALRGLVNNFQTLSSFTRAGKGELEKIIDYAAGCSQMER